MRVSAVFIISLVFPAVVPAFPLNIDPGLHKRLSRAQPDSKVLRRAADSDATTPEPGALKKLFLDLPMIEILDPKVIKALEAMPDSVFDKLGTVTEDEFLAYLDHLVAGKVPE
ncbi:hypothetical protein TWF481_001700 [Arthrobotrys musiformis]|uniref:Uncharacterized protein n=1 Tax=Arthrobotrys musiformis TaxID=47236 RepID=A0AAV9VVB0_9PEZI